MIKKIAFTLSEVLLVISIIGVVSAITLPNLSKSTSDAEVVAHVQKTASLIANAFETAKEKYGDDLSLWVNANDSTDEKSTVYGKRLAEFLNVKTTCGLTSGNACFSLTAVKAITGSNTFVPLGSKPSTYKFILADGTSIGIVYSSGITAVPTVCAVWFDIDGPNKGYNTFGRDIFAVSVHPDATVGNSAIASSVDNCRKASGYGTCSAWVLTYGNVDYIKCSNLSLSNTSCN